MSMIGNFVGVSDVQLARLMKEPARITGFLYDEDADGRKELDVDKAWHAIHFLLTGEAWTGDWPLGFIVVGGNEIGDDDVGYGPARGFTSGEVAEIDRALSGIDAPTLLSRWDSAAVRAAELYAVDPDALDDEADYVGSYYEQLRAFVHELASAGLAMIAYVN